MGRERRMLGSLGESLAQEYLKTKGYSVMRRNFRTPFGELDIVAARGKSLVFVEVKTRASSSLGPPFLSVTRLKQRHIIKSSMFYLNRFRQSERDWRIDVISVKLDSDMGLEDIVHIENAVEDIY